MIIREAHYSDLPEIIELLKASLGEGLIPKSETYFNWKHFQNPFGSSLILLAVEDNKIIGVRAFMRWRWVCGAESVEAVRAVDTATDPAHQGKGIFKKLTLEAVAASQKEKISFVFNSPNKNSLPGYLKMGWNITGKMPLYFNIGSFFPARYHRDVIGKKLDEYDCKKALELLDEDWLMQPSPDFFHTPLSKKYLEWRYQNCPIVRYGAFIEKGLFGMVFRIKPVKGFVELRICELWSEHRDGNKQAQKAYRQLIKNIRPLFVSAAPSPLFNEGKRVLSMAGPFKKGPVTTLRPLAMDNLNNFDNFQNWQPSIGTMELF